MEKGAEQGPQLLQPNAYSICKGKVTFHRSLEGEDGEEATASNKDFIPEIPHKGLTGTLVR